jgi:benzoyl-CoA reductase/2-hydroxyglutaryl-CoA dehydratase subunit BcrC/BadD/HgdB
MISRRLQYEAARHVVAPFLSALDGWQQTRKAARRGSRSTASLFGPPLESSGKLKSLLTSHYYSGRYADGAVPVAWVTSGFPIEVLRPLGFHILYPENHAALCGVKRLVVEYSESVEHQGYSPDLCSYARTDLGCAISGRTPVGRLPRPDLLACCTNICQTVLYWYRVLAEHFQVPLVLVDTPFVYGEAAPHHTQYIIDQLEELVGVAEEVAGRNVDSEELRNVVLLARDGASLWGQCLATGKSRPSPWTGFDGFFHMAPIVSLRGTEECNAYYRQLLDELNDRVAHGTGGIHNEQHRLLWDNLPIWFRIRDLATLLAEHGANLVAATYTNAWAEVGRLINPDNPYLSAAHAYGQVILNRDLPYKIGLMRDLARDYEVDGAILHSDRSCKPYSLGQIDLKNRLSQELGIRALLL